MNKNIALFIYFPKRKEKNQKTTNKHTLIVITTKVT